MSCLLGNPLVGQDNLCLEIIASSSHCKTRIDLRQASFGVDCTYRDNFVSSHQFLMLLMSTYDSVILLLVQLMSVSMFKACSE